MSGAINFNTENQFIIAFALMIALIIFVVFAVSFYNYFSRELQYLNTEIRRTDGEEKRYWIRKRRRLWLSLLPFVKY